MHTANGWGWRARKLRDVVEGEEKETIVIQNDTKMRKPAKVWRSSAQRMGATETGRHKAKNNKEQKRGKPGENQHLK